MKPVDFRNETFATIQNRIAGSRAAVYAAWAQHGPGTTEEVCARWTPDPRAILSFRPRTTELYQLGFIACCEEESPSHLHSHSPSRGARYRIRTQAELSAWLAEQHRDAINPQRELPLFPAKENYGQSLGAQQRATGLPLGS